MRYEGSAASLSFPIRLEEETAFMVFYKLISRGKDAHMGAFFPKKGVDIYRRKETSRGKDNPAHI